MKKKHKWLVLILLFAIIGMGGCGTEEDSDDEQLPTIIDYLDDAPFIEFKHVTVAKTQQLVQGKWRVYLQLGGGINWRQEFNGNYYQEFIGVNTLRTTNPESTRDTKILKWRRIDRGCEIVTDNNTIVLEQLSNDTLTYSVGEYGINTAYIYTVKEK
jgi:hypothetical protein